MTARAWSSTLRDELVRLADDHSTAELGRLADLVLENLRGLGVGMPEPSPALHGAAAALRELEGRDPIFVEALEDALPVPKHVLSPLNWPGAGERCRREILDGGREGREDDLEILLPPDDEFPPAYLVGIYRDGVMEYGTTLEPALRHEDPSDNRIIFSAGHTLQAHAYLQAFGVALGDLGHEGAVAAQVSFDHTKGVKLGVGRNRHLPNLHPINDESVRGDEWRGSRRDPLEQTGLITKDVMDRVFLAAGAESGCWLIDEDWRLTEH